MKNIIKEKYRENLKYEKYREKNPLILIFGPKTFTRTDAYVHACVRTYVRTRTDVRTYGRAHVRMCTDVRTYVRMLVSAKVGAQRETRRQTVR